MGAELSDILDLEAFRCETKLYFMPSFQKRCWKILGDVQAPENQDITDACKWGGMGAMLVLGWQAMESLDSFLLCIGNT